MIPQWLIDQRQETCMKCAMRTGCTAQLEIATDAPKCPLNLLKSKAQIVYERAFPQTAERISGCCDSALNY